MRERPDRHRLLGRWAAVSGGARTRRLSAGVVVAMAVMGLAGCAGPDDAPEDVTPGGAVPPVDADVDPDTLLIQVHRSGGFVPFGWDFANVPELTVYADGRAVTHGPQTAIYPPPALPGLLQHELLDADLDALVASARDAGLLDTPPDYGQPSVADVPTTFVTLNVDGREYAHAAESLGVVQGETWTTGAESPEFDVLEPADVGVLSGLDAATRQARSQLASFVALAHEVVDASGAGVPYAVERLAVMAQPAVVDGAAETDPGTAPPPADDAAGSSPSLDDEIAAPVLAWPLDVALVDAADCLVVDGADAQTLLTTLAGTVVTARFEQTEVRYEAWFRPLLPHEDECSDLPGATGP
jgi:hypothetical protein